MRKSVAIYFYIIFLLLLIFLLGSGLGKHSEIGIKEVIYFIGNIFNITNIELSETAFNLILYFRLPRVIMGLLIGFSLGIAGVIFQASLKNPLADPFTLGVSSGAAFGAALAIFLNITFIFFKISIIPVFAFFGAILTLYIVYNISKIAGKIHIITLILAGVIASAFFSAGIGLLKALSDDSLTSIIFWLMGRLDMSGNVYLNILIILIINLIVSVYVFKKHKELDIISLEDKDALQLGVNVYKERIYFMIAASLISAAAVSFCGIIGFIGLIVPHIGRMLIGPKHRNLLILSGLIGSITLISADIISRIILPHGELPIGILTSLLGAPFFCWILIKKKKELGGGVF